MVMNLTFSRIVFCRGRVMKGGREEGVGWGGVGKGVRVISVFHYWCPL